MNDPKNEQTPEPNALHWRVLEDSLIVFIAPPGAKSGPGCTLELNQAAACAGEMLLAVAGVKPNKDLVMELVSLVSEMRERD